MSKKKISEKKSVKKSASAESSREVSEGLLGKDVVNYERELRRYVKKSGGPRKGLPEELAKRAMRISKKLGRLVIDPRKLRWDTSITVPGMDNPTVKGMVISD